MTKSVKVWDHFFTPCWLPWARKFINTSLYNTISLVFGYAWVNSRIRGNKQGSAKVGPFNWVAGHLWWSGMGVTLSSQSVYHHGYRVTWTFISAEHFAIWPTEMSRGNILRASFYHSVSPPLPLCCCLATGNMTSIRGLFHEQCFHHNSYLI